MEPMLQCARLSWNALRWTAAKNKVVIPTART
jgi:hypothetical protein